MDRMLKELLFDIPNIGFCTRGNFINGRSNDEAMKNIRADTRWQTLLQWREGGKREIESGEQKDAVCLKFIFKVCKFVFVSSLSLLLCLQWREAEEEILRNIQESGSGGCGGEHV